MRITLFVDMMLETRVDFLASMPVCKRVLLTLKKGPKPPAAAGLVGFFFLHHHHHILHATLLLLLLLLLYYKKKTKKKKKEENEKKKSTEEEKLKKNIYKNIMIIREIIKNIKKERRIKKGESQTLFFVSLVI